MKKTLAMILATAATMSLGVTAMAETSIRDELLTTDLGVIEALADSGTVDSKPETELPDDGNVNPDALPTAVSFGSDASGVKLGEDVLEMGTEYKFPMNVIIDGKSVPLTEALMKNYKFTFTRASSNAVKRFELSEDRNGYYLLVETKDNVSSKLYDAKYNVKMTSKDNKTTYFTQEVKFQYGFEESDGDYISTLDKGDEIEIDNSRPVITKSQFDKIAKINDYKNVTLAGPTWSMTVNVTDENTKNFLSNNAGIKELLSEFTEQEFTFYNFPGKPSFTASGLVRLDVTEIRDEYENLYTYRYADGKVYKLKATLNDEDGVIEFRTNKLDNFFVTDVEIKDGFVVTDQVQGDVVDGEGDKDNSSNNGSSNPDKNVPNTGASDMIAAAVAAAMASLAAGAIAVKKRK